MTTFVHSDPDDDPFGCLTIEGFQRDEYNTDGWVVSLVVPDADMLRRVLDRWGPR